jgi:hypothetical protein
MPMEQCLRTVRFASIEIIAGGNHGFRQRRSLVAHRHSVADHYLARAVLASLNSYEEQEPPTSGPFIYALFIQAYKLRMFLTRLRSAIVSELEINPFFYVWFCFVRRFVRDAPLAKLSLVTASEIMPVQMLSAEI